MTYPPERHLLRDLAFRGERTHDRASNRIDVTPGLLDDRGVRVGVLATMVDVTGAAIALASIRPDWIATSDLGVHVVRPIERGEVEVTCTPLRVGARSIVVDARIVDDHRSLCAVGRMAFARIPGSATAATMDEAVGDETVHHAIDGGRPIADPIDELCGFTPVGPGQLRFDKGDYVRNSFGTVNGGVLALAADAAAASACGGGSAVDLQIHYLEQIGDGPVGVTGEVVRDDPLPFVRVRIEDLADGRLVAVSDVTVAPR
ncbi:MAG: hotdog fold thioesterase [Acidimicrobiales bacterium]|nr:hotdog fold thioesterase [Acidimicrobiales bacterium]